MMRGGGPHRSWAAGGATRPSVRAHGLLQSRMNLRSQQPVSAQETLSMLPGSLGREGQGQKCPVGPLTTDVPVLLCSWLRTLVPRASRPPLRLHSTQHRPARGDEAPWHPLFASGWPWWGEVAPLPPSGCPRAICPHGLLFVPAMFLRHPDTALQTLQHSVTVTSKGVEGAPPCEQLGPGFLSGNTLSCLGNRSGSCWEGNPLRVLPRGQCPPRPHPSWEGRR